MRLSSSSERCFDLFYSLYAPLEMNKGHPFSNCPQGKQRTLHWLTSKRLSDLLSPVQQCETYLGGKHGETSY